VQTKTPSFNGINHLKSLGSIFIWESILSAGEGARVIQWKLCIVGFLALRTTHSQRNEMNVINRYNSSKKKRDKNS
jgi:hypothetical protein